MKTRIFPLLCFFAVLPLVLLAQRNRGRAFGSAHYHEVGAMLGISQYSGDVAENNIEPSQTEFGYGLMYRYHLHAKLLLKAHYYRGTLSGDDKNSLILNERKFRFSSPLHEVGVVAEYVVLGEPRIAYTGIGNDCISPVFFVGIASAWANPKPEYYGEPELLPQYTNGPFPEKPDNRQRFWAAPFGLGVRYDRTDDLVLGAEFGFRPVFSDELDGIAVNGNPDKDDWYYFAGITASYVIKRNASPFRRSRRGAGW